MIWQDYVLVIISLALSYALIPQLSQVIKTRKNPLNIQMLFINSLGMLGISIIYYTLNLKLSTLIALTTTSLWVTLLIHKINTNKNKK